MIVFCEECGERYVIEADEIRGSAMIFICRVCNDIIRIPAHEKHPHEKHHKPEEKGKNKAEKKR
jgi:RNase P subunit RPR2